jgi:hypothetical protein
MAYINQPPELKTMFQDIYNRLAKLETAQRFTAPSVDFSTDTPTNPRVGDIFYDTDSERLVYWNGTVWHKLNQSPF